MYFEKNWNRRDILKVGFGGLVASCVPLIGADEAYAANYGTWQATLKNIHTGEAFSGTYRQGNSYDPSAFAQINNVLRDHRTGEAFPMDPRLIDIISLIQKKTGTESKGLNLLSGYRSPKTNNMLRSKSSKVAKNSYHMYGQAADIQIDGYSTKQVRKIAMGLKAGGVGYYPRSNFVHVDTGDIRSW